MFLDVEGRVWDANTTVMRHWLFPTPTVSEKAKIRFISAGNYRTLLIDEGFGGKERRATGTGTKQ